MEKMKNKKILNDDFKRALIKQHYSIVGNHSAVKICEWTKKSLVDKDFCYKQKFYGIRSHLCCQMSPTLGFCSNRCLFCWRAIEYTLDNKMKFKVDNPEEIINECIEAQKKLLSGFGGNQRINVKKFKEAQEPMHFAISLTGEPTIYPKLDLLIKKLHSLEKTTFLVTNGMYPKALVKLREKNALPTQLYISLTAPDEKTYFKVDRPVFNDAWKRLNKSLEFMSSAKGKTRTVIRMTVIRDVNMFNTKGYAELIKKANPDFLEVKAYMHVGFSRNRLNISNMPSHKEVKDFGIKVGELINYKIVDEKENSRVVLLMKEDSPSRIMKF
ncbi:MAG: 4-demethylwyosine synthase TYW1 [Candidatus Woesearchaeota archaeon]